jgi:hypothetical protein
MTNSALKPLVCDSEEIRKLFQIEFVWVVVFQHHDSLMRAGVLEEVAGAQGAWRMDAAENVCGRELQGFAKVAFPWATTSCGVYQLCALGGKVLRLGFPSWIEPGDIVGPLISNTDDGLVL